MRCASVSPPIVDDPVKRVNNMTMAFGLEARVPFLDHELVELAARCPPEIKLKSGGKHLLKAIARGRLPDTVIDRAKGYFPMPALKYVRGRFLEFMHDVLDSRACRDRGLYQRDYVERLLAEPEAHHTRILGSKLWHLAVLELWLQRHLGPEPPMDPTAARPPETLLAATAPLVAGETPRGHGQPSSPRTPHGPMWARARTPGAAPRRPRPGAEQILALPVELAGAFARWVTSTSRPGGCGFLGYLGAADWTIWPLDTPTPAPPAAINGVGPETADDMVPHL
jgi:hypothetical protein